MVEEMHHELKRCMLLSFNLHFLVFDIIAIHYISCYELQTCLLLVIFGIVILIVIIVLAA